jgi:hypothetical protein
LSIITETRSPGLRLLLRYLGEALGPVEEFAPRDHQPVLNDDRRALRIFGAQPAATSAVQVWNFTTLHSLPIPLMGHPLAHGDLRQRGRRRRRHC